MSEIEAPARPLSLNRRLALSSSSERVRRPAERVARTACLGSPGGIEPASTCFGAMFPPKDNCMLYKQIGNARQISARLPEFGNPVALPCQAGQNPYKAPHPWVPGRELNGRSQQFILELMWQGQSARRPVFPPSELASPFRRSRRA